MNHRVGALAVLAALASPARAGVTAALEAKERTSTIYLEGNKLRIDERDRFGAVRVTIFDGDARRLISVDPQSRTYSVTTEADLKVAAVKMKAELERIKTGLTPEQRRQLEAGSGGAGQASKKAREIAFVPTGDKSAVAGFRCEIHRETIAGKPEGEGCYIPWDAGAFTKADLGPFQRMEEFMGLILAGMGGEAGKGSIMSHVARMPGFPARHAEISEDGQRGEPETLISFQRGQVSEELFAPPAGYAKVPPPF
jgi:hypothetical protein